jgi:hypothetical protein
MKTTQKEIKKYLNGKNDLNAFTREQLDALNLRTVAISYGVYGMNGGVFEDMNTGAYYVVPNRSTRLFELV